MDVIIVGARMRRIVRQHLFQSGDDPGRTGAGRAVRVPQLPWVGVHQRFGIERLHVPVGREPRSHLPHRRRIGQQQRRRSGGDRRRPRGKQPGLAERIPGDARAGLGHQRHVVIGTQGERDAPVTGGTVGIELGRSGEGARCLVMVEGPEQAHPLVEIALRLGRRRRHLAVEATQAVEQLRAARPVGDGLR